MTDPVLELRQVLLGVRDDLLARGNVVATGLGYKNAAGADTGELSIVCSVTQKLPKAQLTSSDMVPQSIAGVRTDVVQTGAFRPLAAQTQRARPAPGGIGIGHKDVTAGTLGCLVRRGDDLFILSNNHVLANSNAAAKGDPILQPAVYDGGTIPDDVIATLEDFVPVLVGEQDSGCAFAQTTARFLNGTARLVGSDARMRALSVAPVENLVDAAIARPLSAEDLSADILGIGTPAGTAEAVLGARVRKSGRSTGLTSGVITQVDVTADIEQAGGPARFTDQIMAGPMSQGGDSGSVVVDDESRAVGLLFAGSDSATLMNRMAHVLEALEVQL